MLDAVLLVALKTHWSRADILALPHAELAHYIKRLTAKSDD